MRSGCSKLAEYGDRLLEDLEQDWAAGTKIMQGVDWQEFWCRG